MDYFRSLNLSNEPFLNTTDRGFFYNSEGHMECLQKIEINVRLKRGLSVVTGQAGTGKSILSNCLINILSVKEKDETVLTYVIKDPYFLSMQEFLTRLAIVFGLTIAKDKDSAENLKDSIKQFILTKAVEKNCLLVLIIDEGQQMPDFCYEFIRELINLEKVGRKLLQIVIFGQLELENKLNERLNDRVSEHYRLKPFDFNETREMIRFRIKKVAIKRGKANHTVELFTFMGMVAIFLATSGLPGKIVNLCHNALISMIINKKRKAGWFFMRNLVFNSSDLRGMKRFGYGRLAFGMVVVFVIAFIITLAGIPILYINETATNNNSVAKHVTSGTNKIVNPSPVPRAEGLSLPTKAEASIADTSLANTSLADTSLADTSLANNITAPVKKSENFMQSNEIMGVLTVEAKDSVWSKLGILFNNNVNREYIRGLLTINTHIKDFNNLAIGEVIKIPFEPSRFDFAANKRVWIRIASFDSLDRAVEYVRTYPTIIPAVTIFPYINKKNRRVYDIILKKDFSTKAEADLFVYNEIPGRYSMSAKVIEKMDDIAFCYKIW